LSSAALFHFCKVVLANLTARHVSKPQQRVSERRGAGSTHRTVDGATPVLLYDDLALRGGSESAQAQQARGAACRQLKYEE
jgi:hypothetical protein